MTMKTKTILAVRGGTVLCMALAALIEVRFAPEPEAATATSKSSVTSSVILAINAEIYKQNKPSEAKSKPMVSAPTEPENTIDPEKEAAEFIESGGIEARQDFDKPETMAGMQNGITENYPPTEAPKVTGESWLTDSSKESTYNPKDAVITPTENTDDSKINAALHGRKRDGMIYIMGFGWVKDEGGGGEGKYDSEMYENGNKIGCFG